MPKIYVKFNSAVIKEIELKKDETTIGRKPTNDIALDHPTVSGFHAKIRKQGDGYMIEDLNSTNGTYVNGHKVKSQMLANRDQIGVASHVLEFVLEGVNAPADGAAPVMPAIVPPAPTLPDPVVVQNAPPPHEPEIAQDRPQVPDLERQKEVLRKGLGIGIMPESPSSSSTPPAIAMDAVDGGAVKPGVTQGVIKVISGAVNGQTEIRLKDLVTYIGTSDQAAIKIKGFLAPSLAAAVSKRPEGYFLKAVKSGYPKVNGNPVNEQIFLENGALIEVGGTNMVFYDPETRKKMNKPEAGA